MSSPLTKTDAVFLDAPARALPYLLSWGVLAVLMIVGMDRMPLTLYTPVDGDWAKWNVEAILHFGKVFDLSPYSVLAGMGSMYFPNLPWLNPGALALALPFSAHATSVASYAVYAAELAISIVVLARVIGFSWLMSSVAAQLYLYLLFPPFSHIFRIYDWYSLAPYYAHLQAALNGAAAVLLVCGRLRDWRGNAILAAAFLALFISGLLAAPFTFVFATPAYAVICAALIVTRRPSPAEWAWKIAALALCLIFLFGSGVIDYYLGTIATSARTPAGAPAWDRLLSAHEWLRLFRDHSLCGYDARLLLCIGHRGGWLQIAALCGAALAIITRRGDMRTAAWALVAYIGLAHIYAYAYHAHWLGPASVLSSHFLILSCWSFICMFAVVPFFEAFHLFKLASSADATLSHRRRLMSFVAIFALCILLIVVVVIMLRNPYGSEHYRPAQLAVAAAAIGALCVTAALLQAYRSKTLAIPGDPGFGWRRTAFLSVFPILALVHLSMGIREKGPPAYDQSILNYLRDNASIDIGKSFRGYAATIWIGQPKKAGSQDNPGGFDYSVNGFWDTLNLWRSNIPTVEEYGEWTSLQAHAFMRRLLAPYGMTMHPNYLRAYVVDPDILRALGVRFILTNAETTDHPAMFRAAVAPWKARDIYLLELRDPNLATYSPTRFVKAATADDIARRIHENKHLLDQVAVVSDDLPATNAKARNVAMTVGLDGVRMRAVSDGPAHILLPLQFSHCLVVVNGAAVRLTRANLIQTLMSFDGMVDARFEFRFGLFADNRCRLRDGEDNKALGL
jgi:hypothetical protein